MVSSDSIRELFGRRGMHGDAEVGEGWQGDAAGYFGSQGGAAGYFGSQRDVEVNGRGRRGLLDLLTHIHGTYIFMVLFPRWNITSPR